MRILRPIRPVAVASGTSPFRRNVGPGVVQEPAATPRVEVAETSVNFSSPGLARGFGAQAARWALTRSFASRALDMVMFSRRPFTPLRSIFFRVNTKKSDKKNRRAALFLTKKIKCFFWLQVPGNYYAGTWSHSRIRGFGAGGGGVVCGEHGDHFRSSSF